MLGDSDISIQRRGGCLQCEMWYALWFVLCSVMFVLLLVERLMMSRGFQHILPFMNRTL